MSTTRRGSVLVVVAGLALLIAGLAIAFLARMRGEAEENQQIVRTMQARVMLMAGCGYILEGARVGYDPDPLDTTQARSHAEAFGWIDVRPAFTGAPLDGPRDAARAPLWTDVPVTASGRGARKRWPAIGAAARCPMHVLRQPPFATALTAAYNPMPTDPADPAFAKPYLRHPDPQPPQATGNGWPTTPPADPVTAAAAVSDARLAAWSAGDREPRPESAGISWFRVFRESSARFVVTCGAGATMGFRDWADVTYPPSQAELFGNDQQLFERLVQDEVRLWYRVEWSDAIGSAYFGNFIDNEIYPASYAGGGGSNKRDWDHWLLHPINASQRSHGSLRNSVVRPNHCGTIRWIQRLSSAPLAATDDADDLAW